MDISFASGQDKFNYRVCAIILSGNRILAMHDERSPYYYLPGGRVRMGETAEHAVIREVEEELNIKAKIVRPQNRDLSGGNARRGRRPPQQIRICRGDTWAAQSQRKLDKNQSGASPRGPFGEKKQG